ncbi:MAG: hypothetical protein EBR30_09500 [Cytophagia bacterium]|nr:hypothetical protein [Cytophagia bacterium]
MKWIKKGLLVTPDPNINWMSKYSMMPTPIHIPETNSIRIYYGTTNNDNYGVSTYVEVDAYQPDKIIYAERNVPALNLGNEGTFDDAGAIASSVIRVNNEYRLYYVGFQRTEKVPFMLFPGLAFSEDGRNFQRYSEAPVIDRNRKQHLSFAAPFVMFDTNIYKMWLWVGKEWITINGKKYLSASIGYAESKDGIDWCIKNDSCITPMKPLEFSLGRPWVLKKNGLYKMFYSIRFFKKLYRLGYAESIDGIQWVRKDHEIGIDVSEVGWDSEMICYSSVIEVDNKMYLFYNGNNNGSTGFGWAELATE